MRISLGCALVVQLAVALANATGCSSGDAAETSAAAAEDADAVAAADVPADDEAVPPDEVAGLDTGSDVGLDTESAPDALELTPCFGAPECGTVMVPLDYDDPAAGTVAIRFSRFRAAKPDERIGILLLNPGGPGVRIVEVSSFVHEELAKRMPEVMDRFDFVTFDWRGVGQSEPIHCVDDAFISAARQVDVTPDDPAELTALEQVATGFAAGCTEKTGEAFLRNMHTENAARDMDRLREALGEEKVSYFGISYGTWLGATYATLFPERVRAFVLDSPVGPSMSRFDKLEAQALGYETALERFFADCAADAGCAFHGGTDVATLEAAWDAIAGQLRAEPVPAGDRTLGELDFGLAMLNTLRARDWKSLAQALSALEAGDATEVLALADAEIALQKDGTYAHFLEPLMAIACLDRGFPAGTTLEQVEAFTKDLEAKHPRSARALFSPWYLCSAWPYAHAAAPIGAQDAPPLLLVGGRYDPATIYDEAGQLRDALGNGSHLLTYEGEGHGHLLHSTCVASAAQTYLLDPSAPLSDATCAAE